MKQLFKYIILSGFVLLSSNGYAQTASLKTIPNHIPALLASWGRTSIGQMDSTEQMRLVIGLSLRNRQEFHQLLQNLYNPQSPQYRQFLSHQQVVQQFCPTENAYQQVITFAKAHGLVVTGLHADRMLVDVRGRVAAIQKAFHVKMLLYRHRKGNRNFYAPNTAPKVSLALPIQAISGLSNYYTPQTIFTKDGAKQGSKYPVVNSGSTDGYYNGNDLRLAYLPHVSLNGHGQKVGILEFAQLPHPSSDSLTGGFYPQDIAMYDSISGLPQVPIEEVDVNPSLDYEIPNPVTVDEFSVDIEMANAMAPGLDSIIVYYGVNADDILNSMIANSSVKQFSASWLYWANFYTTTQFAVMAIQGQTFFNGSGDNLSWYNGSEGGEAPPFNGIASDTGVTIVGGTELSTNGPGGSYSSEATYNQYDSRGTGGGVENGSNGSYAEAIPSYQLGLDGINGASHTYRNGPDVAMVALGILEVSRDGQVFGSNGTSFATPLWAGFLALANQQAVSNGYTKGLGFINPLLYSLGEGNSYDNCFHDVQSGTNDYTNSNTGITFGYNAGAGYDLCTGWGSPNGQNLINFLSGPVWDSTVILNSDYTIPSGGSLIILPGTKVEIASGVSITASGVINAVGTSAQPITFTSTGGTSPGSWGSIVISGAGADNSTMKYCNVDYATDIEVTNASNVTIQNCDISNSSGDGVEVYNSSNFLAQNNNIATTSYSTGISIDGGSNNNCYDNVVYNGSLSEQGIGIEYDASSGVLDQNDVDYFGSGILAEFGATPNAEQYPGGRNNRVTNCDYALDIYDQSYCDFGDPPGTAYDLNSVHNNTLYDAAVGYFYSSDASGLYANGDYWGSSPSFYVSSACYGQFNMQSPVDPWNGYPLPSASQQVAAAQLRIADATEKASAPSITVRTSTTTPNWQDSLLTGIRMRENGDFTGAENYLMSFVEGHPTMRAGYVELYGCTNDTTLPAIVNRFKNPTVQTLGIAQLLLGNLYQMENRPDLAEQANDSIISRYPNTPLEVKAEINNMMIDIYDNNDMKSAETLLASIKAQQNLIAPMDLQSAEEAVASRLTVSTSGSQKVAAPKADIPDSYNLSQNYPNPFNPTTVIKYQVPKDTHVTIRVYDILGQQVATLVDGQVSAGYHQVTFNGSRFASGVYFYRISTPGYSKVMKMLELK